jgi:hypothetical protein
LYALKLKFALDVVNAISEELTLGLIVVVPPELLFEGTVLLPLIDELDPLLPMPVMIPPATALVVDAPLMPP